LEGDTGVDAARTQEVLRAADEALDQAWRRGVGVDEALARTKRLCVAVGRDPVIEDAKARLAAEMGCEPAAAYDTLVFISRRTNSSIRDVARVLAADLSDGFPHRAEG
jgi:regulator of sirC expression with transglutaminase-like and TPR domain